MKKIIPILIGVLLFPIFALANTNLDNYVRTPSGTPISSNTPSFSFDVHDADIGAITIYGRIDFNGSTYVPCTALTGTLSADRSFPTTDASLMPDGTYSAAVVYTYDENTCSSGPHFEGSYDLFAIGVETTFVIDTSGGGSTATSSSPFNKQESYFVYGVFLFIFSVPFWDRTLRVSSGKYDV